LINDALLKWNDEIKTMLMQSFLFIFILDMFIGCRDLKKEGYNAVEFSSEGNDEMDSAFFPMQIGKA